MLQINVDAATFAHSEQAGLGAVVHGSVQAANRAAIHHVGIPEVAEALASRQALAFWQEFRFSYDTCSSEFSEVGSSDHPPISDK